MFRVLFPFSEFLYILQLEEYSSLRLIRWFPRFFFRRNIQKRDSLKYTKRVWITLSVSVALYLAFNVAVLIYLNNVLFIVALIVIGIIAVPLFVLFGNILLMPYFNLIRRSIRTKAKQLVQKNPNMKIIAVAGSYGKTTVKNFIYQLIRYSYKTVMIPGNINTPDGIAGWIYRNLTTDCEVLLYEADTYQIGEIRKSCLIAPPDLAIITNIGDQHLERFNSKSELRDAILELFTYSKSNARLITVSAVQKPGSGFDDRSLAYLNEGELITQINDSSLSEGNRINLGLAIEVAKLLHVPSRFVEDTLKNIELPERRSRFTEIFGFKALDSSYNISSATVEESILHAKKVAGEANMKLIVICAGIPELGKENADGNIKLGRSLNSYADATILLNSIFVDDIKTGLDSCTVVRDFKEAQDHLTKEYSANEWFLLLLPELGDLYY